MMPRLMPLQFIAGAGKLDEQEEVYHRMHGSLALSDTYCLDEDIVVARCLAQHYRLAGLACHTSQ